MIPSTHPSSAWARCSAALSTWILALTTFGALSACSTPGLAPVPRSLMHDELFAPPAHAPETASVFTLSPAMLAYANTELAAVARMPDPRQALIDALYQKGRLRLDYDSTYTRNAAQAFDARAGNCLSLVIMTASFAKHLNLPVQYQAVLSDDFYTQSGTLLMASGHVNMVLAPPLARQVIGRHDQVSYTVDFLPQDDLRGQVTRHLDERTIVAMYLNNRAAELLGAGRPTDAYWFARAALLHDPAFHPAANTLGVVYARAGHPHLAEAAYRIAWAADPLSSSALSNLSKLLQQQGRDAEAAPLAARLVQMQPNPPFHHFRQGQAAMQSGDFDRASEHFRRELRLQPFQDEVHFWAAQAALKLGDRPKAMRHLQRAWDFSRTRGMQERYSAKLEHLRSGVRVQ